MIKTINKHINHTIQTKMQRKEENEMNVFAYVRMNDAFYTYSQLHKIDDKNH